MIDMANTVHDPVCGMDIDPATAAGTSDIRGKPITSVPQAAKNLLKRIRRNISARPTNISNIFR
jgi:hypothetical protein